MEARFKIGTEFTRKRKLQDDKRLIVTDIYKTYNSKNECVRLRYVCQYTILGQPATDYDVTDTEIARALFNEKGEIAP